MAARRRTAVLSPLTWLPPVPGPEKIICIGLNYADHARETSRDSAVPGHLQQVPHGAFAARGHRRLPRASQQVDYEAELVLVIGRRGRHISAATLAATSPPTPAATTSPPATGRRTSLAGNGSRARASTCSAPFGPWMVTADEIPDPGKLGIQLRLNGQVMQDSNTSELIFPGRPARELRLAVLHACIPGDLFSPARPAALAWACNPPVYLKPGDVTEVEIEAIGVLRNSFQGE